MTSESNMNTKVAIIGMACRMPGAEDVTTFWQNLMESKDSISTFTDEELLASGIDPEVIRSPNYVKSRGIIGNADHFDASFFGFTPREAEMLDPQHRVFLECAWHAMEDSGYKPGGSNLRIGVFGGVGTNWHLGDVDGHPSVKKYSSGASVVTSNDKDYLTTRVSYKLNLTGPSVNLQCACSTSLVATILGMNSLLSYQSDLILAGGATIEIPEKKGYLYQEGGMESPEGRCRPFDKGAKGTIFSRGAGVIVLKRLADAIKDNDHIYAVIRGGAVNNDGSQKIGFTAPSVQGQEEVAVETFEMARITPDQISFVEAHGTATSLGDPIEVTSLSKAFRHYTDRNGFCALGSVKSNIGHTDVASGMASLIKVALSLKSGMLPATLHFEEPNPKIDFEKSPFFVNTKPLELQRGNGPLLAMINSFGVGGTNACAVLEEPPPAAIKEDGKRNVLLLSAKSDEALDKLTHRLKQHIEDAIPNTDDLAYTCQAGRQYFKHRRFIPYKNRAELLEKLNEPERLPRLLCDRDDRQIILTFPGQGNQFIGMGLELYGEEKLFRETVDQCCEILQPELGVDLRQIMYPAEDYAAEAAEKLDQTYITQPALFVVSYAQARLWLSWGLQPHAMIGHSIGEYVAACLAGIFSLEDALLAVARRGRLVQNLPGGSMLAVQLPEADIQPYLTADLEVAVVNSPGLTVVAGPTAEIEALEGRLKDQRIFHKHLATSHAFHSAMMEDALPEFRQFFETIQLNRPNLPIVSTVTGNWLTDEEAQDPEYWVQHVRRAVRFSEAIKTLLAGETPYLFLESGPGHSCESAIKAHLERDTVHAVTTSMRAARKPQSNSIMEAVGRLWAAGAALEWKALYGDRHPGRIPIPGYPFEREKFALDFSQNTGRAPKKEKKKANVGDWLYLPSWTRSLPPEFLPKQEEQSHCWLLFMDDAGLGAELCQQLEKRGDKVFTATMGPEFSHTGDGVFTISPGEKDHYERCLDLLKETGHKPDRVLHLWNVQTQCKRPDLADLEARQAVSFYSPLYMQQAFIKHNILDKLHILVLVNGLLNVTGEPVVDPLKALAIGPARVINREFPSIRSRLVDVDKNLKDLAAAIILEAQLDTPDTLVSYRNGNRWVESFHPLHLEKPEEVKPYLRENGVYLITGGLGGLGLLFARHMAETAKVNLILTYRSPLPERSQWESWLKDHPETDFTSEKIRGILALEDMGAGVMLAMADGSDLQAMERVVREGEEKFGPINGVIHSAGMAGGGIISLKDQAMAHDVLSPKVQGTLILDQLFKDKDLDFFHLFSSITSILGESGRVDYCSANSFLDSFAELRNQDRPRFMASINWGSWGEVGMAARWEQNKAARSQHREKPVRNSEVPQLQLIGKDEHKEIYDVQLDPEKDWTISTHLLAGNPTLVGTAFLELIHQFAEIKAPGCTAVVDNAYFIAPLIFQANQDRRTRLFVRSDGEKFKFNFKSQTLDKDEHDGPWDDHFLGSLTLEESQPKQTDMAALLEKFTAGVDERPFPKELEGITFGERWQILKHIKKGREEWLCKIELEPSMTEDLNHYHFHPSMTDVALAAGVSQLTFDAYLPYNYKKVILRKPYATTIYSHVTVNGTFQKGDPMITLNVTLYDGEGHELAHVGGYGLKSIKNLSLNPPPAAEAQETQKQTALFSQTNDILPHEGLDASDRIMSAPFLERVVVCTQDLDDLIREQDPESDISKENKEKEVKMATYSRPSISTPYQEPENQLEESIAEIWEGILGIGQIGVNDDFTELGGNSLLAVQVVANTAESFQVDLPIDAFFNQPTVRGMAEVVIEQIVAMAGEDKIEELISDMEG